MKKKKEEGEERIRWQLLLVTVTIVSQKQSSGQLVCCHWTLRGRAVIELRPAIN